MDNLTQNVKKQEKTLLGKVYELQKDLHTNEQNVNDLPAQITKFKTKLDRVDSLLKQFPEGEELNQPLSDEVATLKKRVDDLEKDLQSSNNNLIQLRLQIDGVKNQLAAVRLYLKKKWSFSEKTFWSPPPNTIGIIGIVALVVAILFVIFSK